MRRPHRILTLASWTALVLVWSRTPASATDLPKPPTIAILDFEALPSGRLVPPPQLGVTAAQLLLDRLVASGEYRVLDAHWLAPSGPLADRSRAQAAAIGADFLVLGTITRFSEEHRRRGIGGAVLPLPVLGGLRRDQQQLVIDVLARVIDARSGEVVTSVSGAGVSGRTNRAIGGLGLVHAVAGGGYVTRSFDARDATLAEAISQSIASVAKGLVSAAPRLVRAASAVER